MDKQIPKGLNCVFQLRERFNRDDEIDQEERNELVKLMKNHENEVYSMEENSMVQRITEKMKEVRDQVFTPLNSPDFRTKVSDQFCYIFNFLMNQHNKLLPRLIFAQMSIAHVNAKCEVVIDASMEECAAYNFLYMSRARMKKHDTKDVLVREVRGN